MCPLDGPCFYLGHGRGENETERGDCWTWEAATIMSTWMNEVPNIARYGIQDATTRATKKKRTMLVETVQMVMTIESTQ